MKLAGRFWVGPALCLGYSRLRDRVSRPGPDTKLAANTF